MRYSFFYSSCLFLLLVGCQSLTAQGIDIVRQTRTPCADGQVHGAQGGQVVCADAAEGGSGPHSLTEHTDVSLADVMAGNLLRFNGAAWVNAILIAADIPNLDAAKITSGQFNDARISLSSVKQHEGGLAIEESQISDLVHFSGSYLDLSDIPGTFPPAAHTHDASDITAGTLADARLSVNVALRNAANNFTVQQTVETATPLRFSGATVNANFTTVSVVDPTAGRTFTLPNADSVAVQPFTCSGTDKVSAVSALGVITCTADQEGSAGGGITTLNTLDATTQTFATGTSGTDFNIDSSGSTHTFNLPTASATNRGLLASADWEKIHDPVTLIGTPNYLTISGQEITRNAIDLGTNHVTGTLPDGNLTSNVALRNAANSFTAKLTLSKL